MGIDIYANICYGVNIESDLGAYKFAKLNAKEIEEEYGDISEFLEEQKGIEIIRHGSCYCEDGEVIIALPNSSIDGSWEQPASIELEELKIDALARLDFIERLVELGIYKEPKWLLSCYYSQ